MSRSRICCASLVGFRLRGIVVDEGLAEVQDRRRPEADEDRQVLAVAAVQRDRDEDRDQRSRYIGYLSGTQKYPPFLLTVTAILPLVQEAKL